MKQTLILQGSVLLQMGGDKIRFSKHYIPLAGPAHVEIVPDTTGAGLLWLVFFLLTANGYSQGSSVLRKHKEQYTN